MAGHVNINIQVIQKPTLPISVVKNNSYLFSQATLSTKPEGITSFSEMRSFAVGENSVSTRTASYSPVEHSSESSLVAHSSSESAKPKNEGQMQENTGSVSSRQFETSIWNAEQNRRSRQTSNAVYTSFKMMERFFGKKTSASEEKTEKSTSSVNNRLHETSFKNQEVHTFEKEDRNLSFHGNTGSFHVKTDSRPLKVAGKYVKPLGAGGRMMTQKEAIDFFHAKNPNMTLHEMQRNVNHATIRRASFLAGRGIERVTDGATRLHRSTIGKIKGLKREEMKVQIDRGIAKSLFGKEASKYMKEMSIAEARLLLSEEYRSRFAKELDDEEFSQLLKPTMLRREKIGAVTYRKERLNTDKVLGVKSDRRFWVSAQLGTKNALKSAVKGGVKRQMEKQRDEQKEGSFGQYAIAEGYDRAVRLKQGGEMAIKGLKVAGSATKKGAEMVVASGKSVANFTREGHKLLNEARMFQKDGQGKASDYLKQKAKKSADSYKQEIKKKTKEGTKRLIQQTRKKMLKVKSTLSLKGIAGALRGLASGFVSTVTSAVSSFIGGLIAFFSTFSLVILVIGLIFLLLLFGFLFFVTKPFMDTNAMQGVMTLTKTWEEEYYEAVLADNGNPDQPVSMLDRYTQDIPYVMPDGASNTCQITLMCEEELASYENNFLDFYSLLLVQYNLVIGNMGRDFGNDENTKEGVPSYEEMELFLRDVFDYMYPSDEWDYPRVEMTQDITSYEGLPDVADTEILIHVASWDEVFAYLGWDEYKIQMFADSKKFLEEMLFVLKDEEDIDTSWFDYSSLSRTIYDSMSQEQLDAVLLNAPAVPISREEFASFVYAFCSPSGQINYEYGQKDPATGALDCSGFVAYMLKLQGIDIGSSSANLWENTYGISRSELKAGDLVFKQTPHCNGINHVGFYLGTEFEDGVYGHCASGSGTVADSYSGFVYYRRPIISFYEEEEIMDENEQTE